MSRPSSNLFLSALRAVLALALGGLLSVDGLATANASNGAAELRAVSTNKDDVSGGDVLVRIKLPADVGVQDISVAAGDRDVTAAFRRVKDGELLGLVGGLPVGKTTITVHGHRGREIDGSLTVTNYPITGPIFSGPHHQPFFCQTQQFVMPDGSTLGAALDADCAIAPRIDYVYRSADGKWKPLTSRTSLPADVVRTTTTAGKTVPFVVRIETRTINRGIYQSAILYDPTTERAPTPFNPPEAWNRRLVVINGFGCAGGWYVQGAAQGSLPAPVLAQFPAEFLDATRLGQGYAIYSNTLQHPANNCNGVLGAETAMMSKEAFIKSYGQPLFTVSQGCSGGSYASLGYTDMVPGLFDAVLICGTFPDPLSIAINGLDGHLLARYFMTTHPGQFTDAQILAVTGFKTIKAFIDLANQAGRTDPVPNRQDIAGYHSAVFDPAVPAAVRYDPIKNLHGARPTVFDWNRNVTGVDPATGFALRPFDNVGVQYGLGALNAGAITKAQFLNLNEAVGGYDQDANYVASRSVGDLSAIKRLYQSGVHMSGAGGLKSIPILDVTGRYADDGGYHYQVFHFAARARLAEANGNADNYVIWRGNPVPYEQAWNAIIQWVEAYKDDAGSGDQRDKVLKNRPASVVDGCFDGTNTFIAERQTLSSTPNSRCNTLYPSWAVPRMVAGEPVSLNVLKCVPKAIDPKDYAVAFTDDELARLRHIFPEGVCDWSKPGVNEVPIKPVASVGRFSP